MKKKLWIALMALAPLTAAAQQKWTLDDCLSYAMKNSITLKKSELSWQTATETRKQSESALLPSLSASTEQKVNYRPWTDEKTDGGSIAKMSYTGSYEVNGKWTVWNGNQNHNKVKLDRLSEEKAGLSVLESANTIQESIAKVFVQILYQTDAVEVNRQTLETARKNEERGKAMLEVGKMSKADVAQLSAQRATDEYNLVSAESQLANYKLQLKQLLELTTEEFDVAIPTATDEQALELIPPLTEVYQTALLQRPEIRKAELDKQSGDVQLKIAKAGWLPTFSLSAGVATNTTTLGSNAWSTQMRNKLSLTGGVGVSIPLFDQRKTRTAVNKARIQQLTAELDLQDKQKTLWKTIEGYWLEAQTNQQKFRAAITSVESEQTSYELLSEQFELGLKNIVELMTGKDKLLKAQQNLLQSKYTTILNIELLRFYQGEKLKI